MLNFLFCSPIFLCAPTLYSAVRVKRINSFVLQSPGIALIFVANLVPPITDQSQFYFVGNPSAWVLSPGNFSYANAPTITSISPNYVRCTRTPILIAPGSNQTLTYTCPPTDIDVNGCGYDNAIGILSFCSFYGNSSTLRSDGSKIWNAPYTLGQVTSNQQIRCKSPGGTASIPSSCALAQKNASFTIGSLNFGIAQIQSPASAQGSASQSTCQTDATLENSASWFPLAADTQVNFTFYDDPAYLNFKNATASISTIIESLKSNPRNPLSFLRVSTPSRSNSRLVHSSSHSIFFESALKPFFFLKTFPIR